MNMLEELMWYEKQKETLSHYFQRNAIVDINHEETKMVKKNGGIKQSQKHNIHSTRMFLICGKDCI